MSPKTKQLIMMFEMLPEQEQELAYETMKRFVLAWDPDFTKVSPEERWRSDVAETRCFISDVEIDWDDLQKYAD